MNKIIALLLVLVLFSGLVFSEEISPELTPDDTLWDGVVILNLEKTTFSDSEEISGVVRVHNNELFPLIGQRVVIHLGEGEYGYPSQFARDNVVAEQQIDNIWLIPGAYQDFNFSFPAQGAGNYHLDVYSWVLKSKLAGSSSIYLSPLSKKIIVEGEEAEEKAIINRELSMFGPEDTIGPVGFPVAPGEKFSGTVYVQNVTDVTKNNLKLVVSMCDWAMVFCDNPQETEFNVGTLKSGYGSNVAVELTAPQIPSAYAIQLVLLKGDEVESIYKSRVIVKGGTAKFRKIYLDGLEDADYSLSALFSGSPDHFTFPDFEDFSVGMEVYEKGVMLEDEYRQVALIEPGQTLQEDFDIKSKLFDHICMKIKKDSQVYEEECFDADIKAIQEAYDTANPEPIIVEWKYNEEKEELTINLDREEGMDARVIIITTDSTVYEKEVKDTTSFEDVIHLPKENYTMLIDDFIIKKQMVFNLFFTFEQSKLDEPILGDVPAEFEEPQMCDKGIVCGQGYSCSGQVYDSLEGPCCESTCVPSTSVSGFEILSLPLIVWVALILAVVAAFFARKAMMKVMK